MTKSTKKLKKIEKQFYKALDKSFGLKDWAFIGDMHKGHLAIVITAKEK
jgi:hypothetical protein